MNKKIGNGIQFVLGFGVISLLWVIGLMSSDPFYWFLNADLDVDIYIILDLILTITPFLICLYLLILSIIGKRNNYNIMYYSALSAVCLPIIAYLFGELLSNDSSVLTWILGLTVGWILYPFGMVAINVFDNIDIGFGYEGMYIVAIMVLFVVISIVSYKKIKSTN